jgi:hypothetical protein
VRYLNNFIPWLHAFVQPFVIQYMSQTGILVYSRPLSQPNYTGVSDVFWGHT